MMWDDEKFGGRSKRDSQIEVFKEALDMCNLREVVADKNHFIWCNRRKKKDQIWEWLTNLCLMKISQSFS